MHTGRFVFAELIAHLPHKEFQKCVTRYDGDHHRRSFSCWDRYLAMAFAQFTYRESLRDIEACLGAMQSKLYHLGFRGKVARSTLADANEEHDWRIFADFAHYLIGVARPLHAEDPIGFELDHDLYALDSTGDCRGPRGPGAGASEGGVLNALAAWMVRSAAGRTRRIGEQ